MLRSESEGLDQANCRCYACTWLARVGRSVTTCGGVTPSLVLELLHVQAF